jgi:hypothetical protein
MTEHNDGAMRKALDAVDRHKKRMWVALALVMALTLFGQFRLVRASHNGDISRTIVTAVVVLEFWTAAWACTIVLQLTVMTKRILRAIEISAKPPA